MEVINGAGLEFTDVEVPGVTDADATSRASRTLRKPKLMTTMLMLMLMSKLLSKGD
jgi:hypothetical protein